MAHKSYSNKLLLCAFNLFHLPFNLLRPQTSWDCSKLLQTKIDCTFDWRCTKCILYISFTVFSFTFSHYCCLQDHFKYKCTGNVNEASNTMLHLHFNINTAHVERLWADDLVSRFILSTIVLHFQAHFVIESFICSNINYE